jgi:hypothetical protein
MDATLNEVVPKYGTTVRRWHAATVFDSHHKKKYEICPLKILSYRVPDSII